MNEFKKFKKDLKKYHRIVSKQLGSKEKADVWFDTKNPLLGNVSPIEMIKSGRWEKLFKFIEVSSQGNHP